MLLNSPDKQTDPVLQRFRDHLPQKVWAGDGKKHKGIFDSSHAVNTFSNIQFRRRDKRIYIAIDVDHAYGAILWDLAGVPCPTLIMVNRENGHAHYLYELSDPPLWTRKARVRPQHYYEHVKTGLMVRLNDAYGYGVDFGYAGHACKNPVSDKWTVYTNDALFGLDELNEYVPAGHSYYDTLKARKGIGSAYGRNCALFDEVRLWAYPKVQHALDHSNYDTWFRLVLDYCERLNEWKYDQPLPYAEVKSISKSVALWCWDVYSGYYVKRSSGRKKSSRGTDPLISRGRDSLKFSPECTTKDRQVASAAATASQKRTNTANKLLKAIDVMRKDGQNVTKKGLARSAGVGVATVKRYWDQLGI